MKFNIRVVFVILATIASRVGRTFTYRIDGLFTYNPQSCTVSTIRVINTSNATSHFLVSYSIGGPARGWFMVDSFGPFRSPIIGYLEQAHFPYENPTNGSYVTIFKHSDASDYKGAVIEDIDKLEDGDHCYEVTGTYDAPTVLPCANKTKPACFDDNDCIREDTK